VSRAVVVTLALAIGCASSPRGRPARVEGPVEIASTYGIGQPINASNLPFMDVVQAAAGPRALVTDRLCGATQRLLTRALAVGREGFDVRTELDALIWQAGLPAQTFGVLIQSFQAEAEAADVLAEVVAPLSASRGWPWVCVQIERDVGRTFHVALLYTPLGVILEDIPRTVADTVSVTMQAPPSAEDPELFLGTPQGDVISQPLVRSRVGWETSVPVDDGDGVYWLNVSTRRGPYTVLEFAVPLFGGRSPPKRAPRIDRPLAGQGRVEDRVAALINRERAQAGLRELARDERLDVIARSSAAAAAVGGMPPLTQAEASLSMEYDEVAAAWGMERDERSAAGRLATYPFYRKAYLNALATNLGVGWIDGGAGFGHAVYFGAPPDIIEPSVAVKRVRRQVRQSRSKAKSGALVAKDTIDAAVQAEVPAVCEALAAGERFDAIDFNAIGARLHASKLVRQFHGASVVSALVARPLDLSSSIPDALLDPRFGVLGLGACQGDFPEFGRGRVLVLMLLIEDGRRRRVH